MDNEARPILLLAFRPLDERLEEQSLAGKKGGEKMGLRLPFGGRKEAPVIVEADAKALTRPETADKLISVIKMTAMGSLPRDRVTADLMALFPNEEVVNALLRGVDVCHDPFKTAVERKESIGKIVEGVVDIAMSSPKT